MESHDGEGSQSKSFSKRGSKSDIERDKLKPCFVASDAQHDATPSEQKESTGEYGLDNVAIGTENSSDSISDVTMDDKRYKKRKRAFMDDVSRDSIRKGKWTVRNISVFSSAP
jgi:hypothetical protein